MLLIIDLTLCLLLLVGTALWLTRDVWTQWSVKAVWWKLRQCWRKRGDYGLDVYDEFDGRCK